MGAKKRDYHALEKFYTIKEKETPCP